MLTATLTADSKVHGDIQRTHGHAAFIFINARAFGDTPWMGCVQLAVMRSEAVKSVLDSHVFATRRRDFQTIRFSPIITATFDGQQPAIFGTVHAQRSKGLGPALCKGSLDRPYHQPGVTMAQIGKHGSLLEPETLVITNEPSPDGLIVSCNGEPQAKLQADLEIPNESLPVSFFLPGKFLLGNDYWNAGVEMVCVDSDSPFPESSLPFHLLAPSHRQVWRARIFHFSQDIFLRAITSKTQFKLDLGAPSVPFVEITWHPNRGFRKSFHGLEHVDPKDIQTVVRALEKNFKRWSLITQKRGRKAGAKTKTPPLFSKESLGPAIDKVIIKIDTSGARPTRDLTSKRLGFSGGKALYRLQKTYGENRNWRAIVREALKE